MALVSVLRRYNFSKAEIDGSRWAALDRTDDAFKQRLTASVKLLCPEKIKAATDLPEKRDDYQGSLNTFRWTLGLESDGFDWTQFLANESINVQLIFDVFDQSVSIYEAYGVLESLSPTMPIPQDSRDDLLKRILGGLGSISKDSSIPFIKSTAPVAFSIAADSIPSTDSKDKTLWYLRRFYMEPHGCRHGESPEPPRSSYGIEWRISHRLIQTVGSRIAGIAGVLFFHAPEPNTKGPINPEVVGVRMKVGLKPRHLEKDWIHFLWRPTCPTQCNVCPVSGECSQCRRCEEYREYKQHIEFNRLKDVHVNTERISFCLGVEVLPKPAPPEAPILEPWPEVE